MRKTLCVIFIFALLLALPGCASSEDTIQNPVYFSYRQMDLDYGADPGVVDKEARESAGHLHDYTYLLSEYLEGPKNFSLYNPFPRNTVLRSFTLQDGTAFVQLSASFASLTGLDLTLACACLTLTICEMTDAQQVTIRADDSLLDGNPQITMSPDSLLMMDNSNNLIHPE